MELAIPYVLVGPDGTRAVFGNGDAAKADPDFVGWLDAEQPITGLLGSADTKTQPTELVAGDGVDIGATFLGGRPGTINVMLDPNTDIATRELRIARLKRASRGLRADCELSWTPSVDGIRRLMRLRRNGKVDPTGRRPVTMQLPMASGDAYVFSYDEASASFVPSASGEIGIPDPILDPITSDFNTGGSASIVTNLGDAETWPRIRIDGPITNPAVLNVTTGQRIGFNVTLADSEYLMIYPEYGQVLLGSKTLIGGTWFDVVAPLADRYGVYDFALSTWWQLAPGNNDVRLLAFAFSAGALVTLYFRHAWE